MQESLQRHRPEFIHQSRQRVERLALQAEERRLQEYFGERQEVYGRHRDVGWLPRPAGTGQRASPGGCFLCSLMFIISGINKCNDLYIFPSAGTALLRRAVPRKEMIQRSKQ